jgi:hypothetical protein
MSISAEPEVVWPSINDVEPTEQGGPNARIGFNYQDEVAVSILLDMLSDESFVQVHCETHDDIIAKKIVSADEVVEYIQVKAGAINQLWTVAELCSGNEKSIFAKSLSRDCCREHSRFRLVTLRPVSSELKPLTYPCYGTGREPSCEGIVAIANDLKLRFPDFSSAKGNGIDYWIEHCYWDERSSERDIRDSNILRILRLSVKDGMPLLPEHAEIICSEMRMRTAKAGAALWLPDKEKKIIRRAALKEWWIQRLQQITDGASEPSGGKLTEKLGEALLADDQVKMALSLRRDYSQLIRTPRYMIEDEALMLQGRVKSELATLRSRLIAGQIDMDGRAFHALCLDRMDAINASRSRNEDQSAFLKGCMYDIADRCLHRFVRPAK